MKVHAKAPLRISFCGGGTDIPAWSDKHGGVVLSAAIKRYAHAIKCPRPQPGWEINQATQITYWADVPRGSGLGASSALSVAILAATDAYHGLERDRSELAREAYRQERGYLRQAGGKQDHWASAFGGLNVWRFTPEGEVLCYPRPVPEGLEESLLLVWTGAGRKVDGGTLQSKIDLGRTRALAEETIAWLGTNRFGKLLHEAWEEKKRANPLCTTPRADELYDAALKAGAEGGKLCGAGGGGYLLLHVPPDRHWAVEIALKCLEAKCERVEFDMQGVTVEKQG